MSDEQQTFHAFNPATGERLEPGFREASDVEVDAALTAAAEAFRELSADDAPPRRGHALLLDELAARIMDLGDALLERAESETALPRPRLVGERARTVNQLRMFANIARDGSWVDAVIDTADPARTPAPKPDLRRMLRPRGPVVVFGASNFPFAFGVLGGDTASALAAGCPVVAKGHPSHPGTSEMFARAARAALASLGYPAGWFTLLQGRSPELGAGLVTHPATTAVGFTGSLRAGRALFDLAAARPEPIPVYAEMGSTNPLFVLPGAIAERAEKIAADLAASVLLGGGQFCTKPGLIFTVGPDDQRFVQQLAQKILSQPAVTMLNQPLRDNFSRQIGAVANVSGVTAVAGAGGQSSGFAATAPALFETDSDTWREEQKLHEEAFGPASLVVRCASVDDAIDCIDSLDGSLTGTVHIGAADADASKQVVRRLETRVGRVVVNGYPTGVEVNDAIVHGGPYPATTDGGFTSVGSAAIRRWARLIAYQDTPDDLLPPALRNANPLGIERTINGKRTRDPIG